MNDPRCKRFYRNYEEFSLCVNIGDAEYVLAEHPNERYTSFYYGVCGSGKIGRMFESDYLLIESKKITDVQDYLHSAVIFQSEEDFHLIGFNTPNKAIKWNAELLENKKDNLEVKRKTILLCFDGNFSINGKIFKRYDYSIVEPSKEYIFDYASDDAAIGLFTQQNILW